MSGAGGDEARIVCPFFKCKVPGAQKAHEIVVKGQFQAATAFKTRPDGIVPKEHGITLVWQSSGVQRRNGARERSDKSYLMLRGMGRTALAVVD